MQFIFIRDSGCLGRVILGRSPSPAGRNESGWRRPMSDVPSRSEADPGIIEASAAAQELLGHAFDRLEKAGNVPADATGRARLFFPNGIELIHVKVQLGSPDRPLVSAELKIAGERGATNAFDLPELSGDGLLLDEGAEL
jgi:hypothetical protein